MWGGPESVGAALGAAALYLGRHALLYLAIQRWVFEWDSRWWAKGSQEAAAQLEAESAARASGSQARDP